MIYLATYICLLVAFIPFYVWLKGGLKSNEQIQADIRAEEGLHRFSQLQKRKIDERKKICLSCRKAHSTVYSYELDKKIAVFNN